MTGSGTLADPFVIWDVNDLQNVNLNLTAYYELANDIDATITVGWNGGLGFIPIEIFKGHFDGKGYAITNLFINRPLELNTGLFGDTLAGSVIQYVHIVNCNITGHNNTGALVGRNHSPITGCSSSGTVSGAVLSGNTGGLVGYNFRPISRCFSTCNITAHSYGGGLIGYNATGGEVSDCYARGNVTVTRYAAGGLIGQHCDAATLVNSYSTGIPIAPEGWEGGLIGHETGGATDTACFWDTETSGTDVSDGGTGKTTAQMKTQFTFTDAGWDFITIWNILPAINDGYSYLRGMPIVSPAVTTNAASVIADNSATLNGILDDDGGEACDCGFEWGEAPALGNITPTQSGTTGTAFVFGLAGLTPGQTYYFRAFATNSAGTSYGSIISFTTTLKATASVMTLPATGVT